MGETIPLYLPPLGGPSNDAIAAAKQTLSEHEAAIKEQARNALVRCTSQTATGKGCGTMHKVGSLEYIQTHWYVEPHGCSGGDYWNQGEGQWLCPSCGHRNRLYDSPDVTALKYSFASIKKAYDRH